MTFPQKTSSLGFLYAGLAALAYGFSTPFNKTLLNNVEPLVLSGWFYLFSGLSLIWSFIRPLPTGKKSFKRNEIPIIAFIVLSGSILAPFFIFLGLKTVPAYQASLFLNFEVIFTIMIAIIGFREKVSAQVALGIIIVILILFLWSINFELLQIFENLSYGIIFILLGCLNYGIDNNLTNYLGNKSAPRLVAIKGIFGGMFSLNVALFLGFTLFFSLPHFLLILIIGVISYGMSIILFIRALQRIGTIKTSIIFSTAPFLGSIFSILLLSEPFDTIDFLVFIISMIGVYLIVSDKHIHYHSHGIVIHSHIIEQDDIHHMNLIIFEDENKKGEISKSDDTKVKHIHKKKTHTHSHSHDDDQHQHEHNDE